ncbi:MAG: 4-hydroxy-tetrahydrodipicolinate reductase [Gaiellales bacterium]|nr:4-hydroxy-tetrahydrodipicolinate reductase [Gaiellales bacterium]
MTLRVAVVGATGRTGRPVADAVSAAADLELVARIAPSLAGAGEGAFGDLEEALAAGRVDVVCDFTRADLLETSVAACLARGLPLVLGTTGVDPARRARFDEAAREAGVPIFHAPNFALGAVLAMRFAAEAARHLPRVEIVELHSEHKLDRPSGTAAATAERVTQETGAEVPIHSIRLPGLVAHQETLLAGPGELLTIRHDALSRDAFVPGSLLAIRRVRDLPPGLTVGLEALLDS